MSTENIINTLSSFILNPKSIEIMRNNPKLVKMLTNTKALPSSVRLYLRNLAGVTDKITEDFFSKSELSEIKKRVAKAEAEGSMGNNAVSGLTTTGTGRTNIIGYELDKGKLSFAKAFTDPATNIDMTLGQATFSKDDEGNFIVKDKHNFSPNVGGGTLYDNKEYFEGRKEYTKVIPHLDTYENLDKVFSAEKDKEWLESMKKMMPNTAESYKQYESDKQILERAKNALEAGDIDASKYARIVAGFQQGEEIPVELNLGTITQEDKYEAKPDFAKYIAQDTGGKFFYEEDGKQIEYPNPGIEYENVGIPSEIRKQAQKYVNQNMATGGRVGYSIGSPEPLEINDREKTIAFDLFQRLKDIEEQYTGERIVGDPSPLNLDTGDKGQGTLMADASTEMDQAPDSFLRPRRYDIIEGKELPAETLDDFDVMFRKPNATGGRVMLKRGTSLIPEGMKGSIKPQLIMKGPNKGKYAINRFVDGKVQRVFLNKKQADEFGKLTKVVLQQETGKPFWPDPKREKMFIKDLEKKLKFPAGKATPIELRAPALAKKYPEISERQIERATKYYRENLNLKYEKGIGADDPTGAKTQKERRDALKKKSNLTYEKRLTGNEKFHKSHMSDLYTKDVRTGTIGYAKAKINMQDLDNIDAKMNAIYKKMDNLIKKNPKDLVNQLDILNKKGTDLAAMSGGYKKFEAIDPITKKPFVINFSSASQELDPTDILENKKLSELDSRLDKKTVETLRENSMKNISKFAGKVGKPGIMGALKASRFLPVVGAIATPALAAYGLYDAYKKGYTRPDELLASAAFGSGVSLKDKIKYAKSKKVATTDKQQEEADRLWEIEQKKMELDPDYIPKLIDPEEIKIAMSETPPEDKDGLASLMA